MNMAVFAYGTLQIPEVMAHVAGRQLPSVPAVLQGYQRLRLKGKSFPGIKPQSGASVSGLLYQNLTNLILRRLDDFEDDFYVRREVDVITLEGEAVRAQAYIVEERYHGLLEEAAWDLEQFRHQSLPQFLHRCKTFASGKITDPPSREL